MNGIIKYQYPIKRSVIYVSALQIFLPVVAYATLMPSTLTIIVLVAAALLSMTIVIRSTSNPGLEITEREIVVRSPFHTETYDTDRVEGVALVKVGREKHVVGLKVGSDYVRRKRGFVRFLLTKPFGTGTDVLIPDIYQASSSEILDCLNSMLSSARPTS